MTQLCKWTRNKGTIETNCEGDVRICLFNLFRNNFPLPFVVAVIRDSQMREIATMRARVVELESEADRLRRQLTNEKFERSVRSTRIDAVRSYLKYLICGM